MANEFIARKGLIVLANGAKVTGSLGVQGDINATGYNVTASNLSLLGSASIAGDITIGGNLTVGNADVDKYWKDLYVSGTAYINNVAATSITGSVTGSFTGNVNATTFTFDIDTFGSDLTGITVAGTDKLPLSDGGVEGRINVSQLSVPLAGTGLEANSGTIRIASTAAGNGLAGGSGTALSVNTSSAHFISGARATISSSNTTGASGITFGYNSGTGAISASLLNSSVTVSAGSGLSGGGSVSLGSSTTITVDSGSMLPFYSSSIFNRISGDILINTANGVATIQPNSVALGTDTTGDYVATITAGDGINTTGASTGEGIAHTLSVNTASAHFITGSTKAMDLRGVFSSSVQTDVRQTTGIATIATTGSNTFTGVQTISNTTNSTAFNNGALIVQGGVGIAKDVNISGSLNVTGILTAATMSTQYVTSSQYVVGVSRVIVNDDDLVRFAGLSVVDSGSSYGTGSLLWDSLYNRWIYQADDLNYNSAVIIAGPKNDGTLGNEVGLTDHRVPVAHGDDHIDSRIESSSIRIDFPTRLTHIEAGLHVTGAVTSSVGFSGDGSQLTGIVTNLNLTGSEGGTGTVSLKTQALTIDGENGIAATVSGQTITISGSNATTTVRGVAAFTGSNFAVAGGVVSSNPINFNGANINLGGTHSFGLQNITPYGASTTDQVSLQGGAIINGVLFTSASNSDVDTGTEIVASVSATTYDAAFFDYVVKKGNDYRVGTVMAVWNTAQGTTEFTDTSTNDIGNTTDVTFTVDLLSNTARLKATVVSDNWIVKTAVRAM